ncbi:hypothetical protein FQA39_LY17420 [Lamprigera yunnana]|nr:hypothetical protein FQA39_LY17420 [Lamprigera yunnana]
MIIKYKNEHLVDIGPPLDYSFKQYTSIKDVIVDAPRTSRVGRMPTITAANKYFSRAIWLNNNKLTNMQYINDLVKRCLHDPMKLGWLDISYNFIPEIDVMLAKLQSLSILYLHGNLISNIDQVLRLYPLKNLKSVTFHGNPISESPEYRTYVTTYLPQVRTLDFSAITLLEQHMPKPADAVKKLAAAREK